MAALGQRHIPISNIQEPSSDYAKRPEEDTLQKHLEDLNEYMIVLHGMHGCGKTYMGRKVLYELSQSKGFSIWEVDGSSKTNFYEGLTQLWNTIKPTNEVTPMMCTGFDDTHFKDTFLPNLKEVFGNARFILLVDRAGGEMLELISQSMKFWVCLCLSQACPNDRFTNVPLKSFEMSTAVDYVKSKIRFEHNNEIIDKLVRQVSPLPLALALACNFISKTKCPVRKYITYYHTEKAMEIYSSISNILKTLPEPVKKLIINTSFLKPEIAIPSTVLKPMVCGTIKDKDEILLQLKEQLGDNFAMIEVKHRNKIDECVSYHTLIPEAIRELLKKDPVKYLGMNVINEDIISNVLRALATVFIKEAETPDTYQFNRQMAALSEGILEDEHILESLTPRDKLSLLHIHEAFAYIMSKQNNTQKTQKYYCSAKDLFFDLIGMANKVPDELHSITNTAGDIVRAIQAFANNDDCIKEDHCFEFRKRYIVLAGCIKNQIDPPDEEELILKWIEEYNGNADYTMVTFLKNVVTGLNENNAVNIDAFKPVQYLIERFAVLLYSNGIINKSENYLQLSKDLCSILKQEYEIEALHSRKAEVEIAKLQKVDAQRSCDISKIMKLYFKMQNILSSYKDESCTYFGIISTLGFRTSRKINYDLYFELDIKASQLECVNIILDSEINDQTHIDASDWEEYGRNLKSELSNMPDEFRSTVDLWSRASNANAEFEIITSNTENKLDKTVSELQKVVKREEEMLKRGNLYIDALMLQTMALNKTIQICECGNKVPHHGERQARVDILKDIKNRMSDIQKQKFRKLKDMIN